MPIPLRPSSAQALSVEPTPTNGSSTVSPGFVKKRMRRDTSVKEKGAGCWRSICASGWPAPRPRCIHTETVSGIHSFAVRAFSLFRGSPLPSTEVGTSTALVGLSSTTVCDSCSPKSRSGPVLPLVLARGFFLRPRPTGRRYAPLGSETISPVRRLRVSAATDGCRSSAALTEAGRRPADSAKTSARHSRTSAKRSMRCSDGGDFPASTRERYAGSTWACAATSRRDSPLDVRCSRTSAPKFMTLYYPLLTILSTGAARRTKKPASLLVGGVSVLLLEPLVPTEKSIRVGSDMRRNTLLTAAHGRTGGN